MSLGQRHAVAAGGTPASGSPARWGRVGGNVFSALRHRNFRLFWFGQFISVSGTWMQSIGQSWLVLVLTKDAFLLGLVAALQFLPVLIFSLYGGVIADRLPKRRVLILTQSAAAVQAFVLFILAATGVVQVWHIMILALCLGVINALDMPTRQAFVSEMVNRDDLMNAISLNSAQFNASRVVGPGVAAAMIALLGIPPLFLLNAVSYIAVIAGLLLMDPAQLQTRPATHRPRTPAERPLRQIREGLIFSWRTPPIRLALIVLFFISTFGMNFSVILPLLADFVYRSGATGYGLLSSVMGAGSLIAALALAGLVKRPNITLLVASGTGFGVLLLVLAGVRAQPVAFAFLFLIGVTTIAFAATCNTLLQTSSPDHMRGRVMGLYAMVFAGTTPIGALYTGYIASQFGARAALAADALPCVIAVVYGWLARKETIAAQTRLTAQLERERAAAKLAATAATAQPPAALVPSAPPPPVALTPAETIAEQAIAD